jgi:hypothetical protein
MLKRVAIIALPGAFRSSARRPGSFSNSTTARIRAGLPDEAIYLAGSGAIMYSDGLSAALVFRKVVRSALRETNPVNCE